MDLTLFLSELDFLLSKARRLDPTHVIHIYIGRLLVQAAEYLDNDQLRILYSHPGINLDSTSIERYKLRYTSVTGKHVAEQSEKQNLPPSLFETSVLVSHASQRVLFQSSHPRKRRCTKMRERRKAMTQKPQVIARQQDTDELGQLFQSCPVCKHAYASNFTGYEYVLTGQVVCQGSPTLKTCIPTVYLCFSAPLSSLRAEIVDEKGQKYRGVVYVYNSEEIDDDR